MHLIFRGLLGLGFSIASISASPAQQPSTTAVQQPPTANAQKKSVDPSGTWRWEYDLQGNTIKDRVEIDFEKDVVSGTFYGQTGAVPIEQAKLEGDELSFRFPLEAQGFKLKLAFRGKIKDDNLDGNVVIDVDGQTQEYPWTPKRGVMHSDVAGEWKLKIETPDNQSLRPTLNIKVDGEKISGSYTADTGETLEPKDLKVKDNQLEFTIESKVNGADLVAKFKGRPYGKKLRGKIAYEIDGNSGEIDFQAERSQKP